MKSLEIYLVCALASVMTMLSCEVVDDDPQQHVDPRKYVELSEVAQMIAALPIHKEHLHEVFDAVSSSCGNGYDEEYTMNRLFDNPGSGVGENTDETRASQKYERPLRDLIQEYVLATKSSGAFPDPQRWLDELMGSDVQIYWPYSENWDGETFPIITFDPEDDSEVNVGYRIKVNEDGGRVLEEVVVDEQMAMENPVWVINRNSDAAYKTLEILRKEDPDWGSGGGDIVVTPSSVKSSPSKCLVLKSFKAKRNYDCWFAGASEFFVKIGAVNDFTASTEAELKLYNPRITDFMIVVTRGDVNKRQLCNTMLISEWTEQMTHCAFMMNEDDGGTWTEWKCTALVRIASKSYGIEINLPIKSWDDVVWRGRLAWDWLEKNSGRASNFGDVELIFDVQEY